MAEISNLVKIGNRIKLLRKEKGWKQEDFAKIMGVTRTVVGKWETGLQDFKTEHIIKMADKFGVTCDYLLRGIKSENVDINRDLKLCDEAIIAIMIIKNNEKYITIFNKIISSWGFYNIIRKIEKIQESTENIEELSICQDGEETIKFNEDELQSLSAIFHLSHNDERIKQLSKRATSIQLSEYYCERVFRDIIESFSKKEELPTLLNTLDAFNRKVE